MSIYNLLGAKVATLVSENQQAGQHTVEWDASGFASGVYYYRLKCDAGFIQTKKLVLLK
ncbi:MAG: T9SS type A sorting domain-containing protein [Calditrichia bacterium]|nr:T9SS type A sorting domain-containing protein [Calditrichia bacterium]